MTGHCRGHTHRPPPASPTTSAGWASAAHGSRKGGAGGRGGAREAPGLEGTRQFAVPWCWPRAKGHATTGRAPAGGAQERQGTFRIEGSSTRRASSGAGRGQEVWVAGAQGARGAGARRLRGMLGHACSRGRARRAAPGHGQQLCAINLERCARNLWAKASRAVGERRLEHEALSQAQWRALGARGASRLGSWAPHLPGARRSSKRDRRRSSNRSTATMPGALQRGDRARYHWV